MSTPIAIANKDQAAAIRPELSVWVTASAGSGKTKVLTERVLSLLLTGTAPARILCLTFTKAAAAEMSNRINTTLAGWVNKSEIALEADLARLLQDRFTRADRKGAEKYLARARRLFAEVLDSPGGLQISTLHAFCQSLLRRFPLEARIPPHFALMDERDAAEALEEALEAAISARRDDTALKVITARVHESLFAELMSSLVAGRAKLKRAIAHHGGLSGAIAALRRHLELAPGETEASILASACDDSVFACDALRRAVQALANGSSTDQERGRAIADWLETPPRRVEIFYAYTAQFLTNEGTIRSRMVTKAVLQAAPGTDTILATEAERLVALVARVRAVRVAEASAALMTLGARVLALYEAEKARRGLMDYDDLIQTTRDLLAQRGVADWVLYKLDGGIDHILIDEAQDTNPDQWAIVDPILDEFFAGVGSSAERRGQPRTVFSVGDRKQSIYSFQGAAPETFDRVQGKYRAQVGAAEQKWADVTMNVSFRSGPAVLSAVNAVFAQSQPARMGVAREDEDITHLSAREGAGGLVEVWPLVVPQTGDDPGAWKPPVERTKGDSPQGRLAGQVAKRIARMVKGGEMLESKGRPIRAGDIMVLVRRRTGFVEDLVRQLKKLGINVAGVDRMVLTEQMAIMDLVALGQFLLLPEDDLTLATVLKGPLVGLTEEELFTLAYNRSGALWDGLTAQAGSEGAFGKAQKYLADLMARTDFLTPAELYAHILIDGRRKLLARLGIDADDPIDEFMNLALAYQQSHPPSLQGFLQWLAAGDTEIKRDLEQGSADAVRIITVHGAKGLEAPIVFMPDTAQVPTLRDPLLWTPGDVPLLLWCSKAAELDPVSARLREDAKDAQLREYHRLLYVAMTRAADRLYVCGWQGQKAGPLDGTWYGLIKAALAQLPQTVTDGDVLRLASPQSAPVAPPAEQLDIFENAPLPTWASTPPPPEDSPPRPLAPSRAGAEPAALSPLRDDGKVRYQRGLIIHRLLQSLPDLPPARRRAAAEAFVRRPAWELEEDTAAQIVDETLRVLDHHEFAPLFAPGSRAEVSLSGLVGKHVIAAQVDRLAVTATEVLIIDYKTNRPPPRDQAHVDPAYMLQMATYRAALASIYPRHTVRCVLLWTDGPFVMELDAALMDEAILRII